MSLRRVTLTGQVPTPPKAPPLTSAQAHAKAILELPKEQLDIIIASIREGISYPSITKFFMEQGWLTVTERSFVQYLSDFRVTCPEVVAPDDDYDAATSNMPRGANISGLISKNMPSLDEEKELEQLIRLQSLRIRIGVQFEKDTGIMNQHISKDVNASNELLKTLASVRGKLHGAGRPGAANSNIAVGQEAAEALRRVEQSESSQEKMVGLVGKLAGLMQAKNGT